MEGLDPRLKADGVYQLHNGSPISASAPPTYHLDSSDRQCCYVQAATPPPDGYTNAS